jgi:predicted HAD superfamily Cof-like phosphohydrolase
MNTMNNWQEQVRDFHREVTDQPTSPAEPKFRTPMLRSRLISEEAFETVFALLGRVEGYNLIQNVLATVFQKSMQKNMNDVPDLVEAIDGLCDTIVVCLGTAEDIGIDLKPFFEEVMRANMAKANGPIDEHGKKQKPPGWTPPDIKGVLARLLYKQEAYGR